MTEPLLECLWPCWSVCTPVGVSVPLLECLSPCLSDCALLAAPIPACSVNRSEDSLCKLSRADPARGSWGSGPPPPLRTHDEYNYYQYPSHVRIKVLGASTTRR